MDTTTWQEMADTEREAWLKSRMYANTWIQVYLQPLANGHRPWYQLKISNVWQDAQHGAAIYGEGKYEDHMHSMLTLLMMNIDETIDLPGIETQ